MSLNVVYHHKQARRADDRAYEERELRRKLARSERECQVDIAVAHPDGATEAVSLKRRRVAPESITPLPPDQRLPMDLLVRTMIVGGAAVALMVSRTCKFLHEEYRRILQRNREAKQANRPQDLIPLRTDFIDACLDPSGLWEDVLIKVYDGYANDGPSRTKMLALAKRQSCIFGMVSLSFTRFLKFVIMSPCKFMVVDKILELALLQGKPTIVEMVSIANPVLVGDLLRNEGIRGALSSVSMIKYLVGKGYKLDSVISRADHCALRFASFGVPFPDIDGARAVIEYLFSVALRRPPTSMLRDEKLQATVLLTYSEVPYRADPVDIYYAVFNQGDEDCIKLALQHWTPPLSVVRECIEFISQESAVLLADKFSYDQLRVLLEDAATFRCETDCFYGLCIAMSKRYPERRMPPIRWGASRVSRRMIADVQARLKEAEHLVGQALWDSNPADPNVGVTDSEPDSSDEDSDSESDQEDRLAPDSLMDNNYDKGCVD